MATEEEVVRIILTASLSFSSILVAIIGFLLSQYVTLKNKPEPDFVLQPYRALVWFMVFELILGTITIFTSLVYLLNIPVYYLILALFVTLVITIVIGVFCIVSQILR